MAVARIVRRIRGRRMDCVAYRENFSGARIDHDPLFELGGIEGAQHIDAATQRRPADRIEPH